MSADTPTWHRNCTDWLHEAGWGVCCHFCFHSPPQMSARDWNRLVDAFDVPGLVRQLVAVRAPYLMFTIGQGSGHYCAPNPTYDRWAGLDPSRCSRRDLISDLADALAPHGIRLIVYAPADGSWADHEARKGLGLLRHWNDGVDRPWPEYRLPEFLTRWEDICRDWSLRFGRRVHGWIIDGAYHRKERYPDDQPPNLRTYAQALRSGNPEAMISFNSGANAFVVAYSPFEDFTSGELVGNLPIGEAAFYRRFCADRLPEAHYGPLQRWIDGEQMHLWNFLGSEWGLGGPRLPTQLVAGWTEHVVRQHAVVSWDAPIGPDGIIPGPIIEQLQAIGQAAARGRDNRAGIPSAQIMQTSKV